MQFSRSKATRIATFWLALSVVSGCSGPGAIGPTVGGIGKGRSDQIGALDALAYNRPDGSGAISLPGAASSQAVPITESGSGRLIAGSSPRPKAAASEADVVLNLSNVPLQQAAKTVLGEMIGVNYVVDPRIDGVISLQTVQPVTKADALELFQAALAPVNGVLVENNGIYRIVPADQAATGTISTGRKAPQTTIGANGVRIVQLKYVAATEVARILEPMVPKGAIVQADDARNILAVKGSPSEVDGIIDSISIFDVDVMRGMSFAVVPVKTSQPEKLVEELKAIFSSEKEGPMKGRVRFIANTRLGAILVVTSQPSYLPRAQEWVKRLDAKANGADPQLHVYQVQNRPVGELAGILQSMFSDEIKVVRPRNVSPRSKQASLGSTSTRSATGAGADATDPGSQSGQARGAPGADLQNLARMLNNDSDQSPSDPTATAPTSTGSTREPTLKIVADDTKNSLIIMANDRDYQRMLRVIQSLDVVPSQVLIEAVIAEVTLNDELQYGVQWQLQKGGTPTATFSSLVSGSVAAALPGFNYAFNAANIAATLSALNSLTHVNVISTPSLMVLDNKTARLQIGDQVPITTQTATSVVTSQTAIVNSVTMQDTGVILSVTPRINESGRVQLEIEQEVSSVSKTTSSSIDSPTIQQRRVKTTVVVNDGEVLALGGMIQDSASRTGSQIPLLGDIPGLGAVFAKRDNTIQKTELIILITPRVVRDGAESRQVTEEYRRKMKIYMPHPTTRERSAGNLAMRLSR